VAYLRIVYTTTDLVGKFFPVRKKSAVVEKNCCTNFFTEKKFLQSSQKFPVEGMSSNRQDPKQIGPKLAKRLYHEAQSYRKVETLN
jgi:hypothetical protein